MKKQRKRKHIKRVFIVLLMAVLSAILGFYFQRSKYYVNEEVKVKYEKVSTVKESSLSMVMVGDALFHATVYNSGKSGSTYNYDHILQYVKPIVENYDLAYYNQETILGGSSLGLSTYPQFNSPQEVGTAFVKAGFNLVSLATNHTLDGMYRYSTKAIVNSRNFWNERQKEDNNLIAAGSYQSQEEHDEIIIREKNGITYGLLSYTCSTNGLNVPSGKGYVVNVYSDAKVKEEIEKYRPKVDVLMVAMHWGEEYVHYPNSEQKRIAKYLSGLGVNIIIGCHPHVIQPIDMVGDTLVIYSLGNFVSSQKGIDRLVGLMASVNVIKTEYHGKTTISFKNIEGDLLYTNKSNKFIVYPFSKLNNSILSDYKNQYNKFAKYVTAYSDKVKMKGL